MKGRCPVHCPNDKRDGLFPPGPFPRKEEEDGRGMGKTGNEKTPAVISPAKGITGHARGWQAAAKRERADMEGKLLLTAVIEREGDGFVGLCPELDIASEGGTVGKEQEMPCKRSCSGVQPIRCGFPNRQGDSR